MQSVGSAVNVGDAILGLAIAGLGFGVPRSNVVRNASDPQIDDSSLTVEEAANKASQIYEKFGYWTTIPSAITCWSVIVDN